MSRADDIDTDNPIHRFRAFLVSRGWWSESEESKHMAKNKAEVLRAFARAEKLPKPKLTEMFNDVWGVGEGEEVPSVIVSKAFTTADLRAGYILSLRGADGAESRAGTVVEEVWRCLGAVEKGAEEIRGGRRGRDGLRREGVVRPSPGTKECHVTF